MIARQSPLGFRLGAGCLAGLALLATGGLGVHAVQGQGGSRRQSPVSPLVFPTQSPSIRAAHGNASHSRLRCARCHQGATGSRATTDWLAPEKDACVACHRAEIEGTEAQCTLCHLESPESSGPRPRPRIEFSHRAHARRGVPCMECHQGLYETGGSHLPNMRQCFECHGGVSPTASTACTTCHLARPDGRIRSRYPEGTLNPPAWLDGMRHDRDWLVRHRWVGADHGSQCGQCHTERDCTDCHDGRLRPTRVHENDYLTTHAQMARFDDPRCTACHNTQLFCTECHARLGLSPLSAPDVRSTRRFHPPAETWIRGPIQHAREARRSMNTCTSCHSEEDCVTCHGALGIGAGLNPHPPSFRARCDRMLRENERACRACHGNERLSCP